MEIGEEERIADPCVCSQMTDRMTTTSPFCFINPHQDLIIAKGKPHVSRDPIGEYLYFTHLEVWGKGTNVEALEESQKTEVPDFWKCENTQQLLERSEC